MPGSKRYPVPDTDSFRVSDTVKKSRFITTMARAESLERARDFVARVKEEFPDATHNCWAFNAGPPGDTARVGLSDDGEPHGTAGKPMLSVLLGSGLGEIAVVVTRYYGGTKLGTGGLVKTYSNMVKLGLENLPVTEKVELASLRVTLPYNAVTLFKRMLPDFEAQVVEEDFNTDAEFTVSLPSANSDDFRKAVTELTNGDSLIELL